MDSAHFMVLVLASGCMGQVLERLTQKKRKLTGGEISFFLFAPVLVGVGCSFLIEWLGFTKWYLTAEPASGKDLIGTLVVLAIGMAAMALVWGLFCLVRKKPGGKASQPG